MRLRWILEDCPRRTEILSFSGEFIPVVLLTVPIGVRRPYAPVNCSLPEDPARETPHTPEDQIPLR